MYLQLLNDPEILNQYKAIEQMEKDTGGWAYHNLIHVKNVAILTEQLLQSLQADEQFITDAKIAALLHDIGSLEGKAEHANRSYTYAKDYLMRHKIKLKHEALVLDAIKSHSSGFETDNIMALVLILADKLDITKQRLAPEGYKVNGLNEIQYIESIYVSIINKTLEIHFITKPDFNQESFENFYFSQKVFKAIKTFSKKLNLNYDVKLNKQHWNIDAKE